MKLESAFNFGDLCFCTNGKDDIQLLTIGLIRVEVIDSPGDEDSIFSNHKPQKSYKEQYMCVETGVGSGNLYTLGEHVFKTKAEAVKFLKEGN